MKKTILLAVLMIRIVSLMAQAPNQFRYQGTARNANGFSIPNKTIKLRLSIREGSAAGIPVYTEVRSVTTNANGVYTVLIGSTPIGSGSSQSGSISALDWGNGSKFLQVEMDPNNGSSFVNMGTTALASNPFAQHVQVTDSLQAGSKINLTALLSGGAIKGQVLRFGTSTWSPYFLPPSTFTLPYSGRYAGYGMELTINGDAPGISVMGVQNTLTFSNPGGRAVAAIGNSATTAAVRVKNNANGTALSVSKFGLNSVVAIGLENAYALSTLGNIRLAGTGMNPVNGGILTSSNYSSEQNESKLVWRPGKIAFQAKSNGPTTLGLVESKPIIQTEVFDLANNFATGTDAKFTAPIDGVYSFRASALVKGIQTGTLGDSPDLKSGELQIRVLRGGVLLNLYRSKQEDPGRLYSYLNLQHGIDVSLRSGDVVELFIGAKAEDISPSVSEVYFSGILQSSK